MFTTEQLNQMVSTMALEQQNRSKLDSFLIKNLRK
jgi:hypothetical protein